MKTRLILPTALAALLALAGCDGGPESDAAGSEGAAPAALAQSGAAERAEAAVVVYKSPTCGCCNDWIEHMEESGFTVKAVDVPMYDEMVAKKREHGVPGDLGSCHTAVVDGYVVEGHVPADAVKRLLAERPDVKGLAVPGMPIGSPGMEGPNPQPYDIVVFGGEGGPRVFERVDPTQATNDDR
jgi:hypothetical protein